MHWGLKNGDVSSYIIFKCITFKWKSAPVLLKFHWCLFIRVPWQLVYTGSVNGLAPIRRYRAACISKGEWRSKYDAKLSLPLYHLCLKNTRQRSIMNCHLCVGIIFVAQRQRWTDQLGIPFAHFGHFLRPLCNHDWKLDNSSSQLMLSVEMNRL